MSRSIQQTALSSVESWCCCPSQHHRPRAEI